MTKTSARLLYTLVVCVALLGFAGAGLAQTNISNSPSTFSTGPRIAVDPAGNIHVVWSEYYTMDGYYPTSGDAFYAKYNITTKTWSTPVNLSNSRQSFSGEWATVGIDADGSGNVYVSYIDGPSLMLRILSGGAWSAPFTVATAGSPDMESARVAVTPGGDIYTVVMYAYVIYSRARIGGVWEDVKTLTYPGTVGKFPEIAVGANKVHCVFQDNHFTPAWYTSVYVCRPTAAGASWTSSQRMTNLGDCWEEHPAVRADSSDVAHVVLTPYYDATGWREVRYVEGTTAGFSSSIVIDDTASVHYPSIAVRGTNVYGCWQGSGLTARNRINGSWGSKTYPGSVFESSDVAVSPNQDKIYYVYDSNTSGVPPVGDIYFVAVDGPGVSAPTGAPIIIAGTVRTPDGNAVARVTLSGLPSAPTTSGAGVYTESTNTGFAGTVAPALNGYTFSPASRSYSGLLANQLDQDYTASTNGCSYSVSSLVQLFPMSGGPGSAAVTSSGGCAWTASSLDAWIGVTGGSSGSGNGTVQFTVASNSGGASRTGTLVVAGRTVTVHQEGVISFNASFGYVVLPECIWATATGGGTWVTEVQLTDATGGSLVSAYFDYGGGGRRGPITVWNNSGGDKNSIKFTNFLSYLASVDSGFSYSGKVGSVEFLTQDADHHVQVAARTRNGNYSKTLPGLIPAAENTAVVSRPMVIQNLTNNWAYRSSCGFFNRTTASVAAEFRLYDGNGAVLGTPFTKAFTAYDFQSFSPFAEAGVSYPATSSDNCVLVVIPTSGSGGLIGFGSSANNITNDPAAHVAVQFQGDYENSPAPRVILPECIWAPATGGGTWQTEVQITDLTGGSSVYAYFDYGGGLRRGPIGLWAFAAGAGKSLKSSNILATIASQDTGFTYSGRVGAVEFVTQDASHKIQVAGRTLNGNASKTLPGLRQTDANTASTSRQMIIGNLTNNSTYRSTCGFFNPTADSVGVEFRLYNGSGVLIGSAFTKSFAGYDFKAFSPFTEAGVAYPGTSVDNVILIVRPTAGAGQLLCFGASANNSSNDPAAHIALQY